MSRRNRFLFGAVAVVAAIWVSLWAGAEWVGRGLNADRPARRADAALTGEPSQILWDVPAFSFVDQDDKKITDQSLRGHAWVADFIYTQCTTACPIESARMVILQKQVTAPDVRFVSFSVDPVHDTPAVLKQYADLWHGDPRWRLLATDFDGLKAVTAGMKVTAQDQDDAVNPILHSDLFFLVDKDGHVRGIYAGNDRSAMDRLGDDLKALSVEKSAGETITAGTSVDRGRRIYNSVGCVACHSQPRIAPPLVGLYGRPERLDGGESVWADAAYLHESIVDPAAKVVAGYGKTMPAYRGLLTDGDARLDVVDYLKSIGNPATGENHHGPVDVAATRPSIELLTDPVCHMRVTADPSAPHVVRDGKTFYFCSESCRDRFLKDPGTIR